MASVEVGRRTQSSYPTFMASTGPSDLTLSVGSTGQAPVTFSPEPRWPWSPACRT